MRRRYSKTGSIGSKGPLWAPRGHPTSRLKRMADGPRDGAPLVVMRTARLAHEGAVIPLHGHDRGPATGGSWPMALGAAQPSGAESRALARRPIVGPPRRSGDLDGPAFRPGRLRIWPRCSARRRPSDRRTAARQWGGSARQRQGRLPGRNPPNETKPPAAELGSEQTPNRLTDPQIERGPRRGPDGLCVSSTSNPREHRHPASRPRSRTGAGCRRRRGRARRGAGCRRTSCGGRRTSRGR